MYSVIKVSGRELVKETELFPEPVLLLLPHVMDCWPTNQISL